MSDFILDPSVTNVFTSGAAVTPEVVATRDPIATDNQYNVGTFWFNSSLVKLWALLAYVNGVPQWELIASSAGSIVSVLGTTNQITATNVSGVVTLSIPTTFIAPGSIASTTTNNAGTSMTAGTTITATLGNITATNGNLVLSGAGNKILIHGTTASSDSVGTTGAMSGGAVTVTSSAVTTSSVIVYSRKTLGTAGGNVAISAQSAGAFTLTSDAGTETSTFNYLIIN